MTRPPAGTVRGPLDGGVPDDEPGVPGAEPGGRAAGGRLGAALPGRDETTRGAGETGGCVADGAAGCVVDGGRIADGATGCAGDGDVGVVGSGAAGATIWGGGVGSDGGTATTEVVGTDVGAVVMSPVADCVADCVADFAAGFLARDAGVFLAVFGAAEASSPEAPSASSAATFLARLGLSAMGSRFKPFSSA